MMICVSAKRGSETDRIRMLYRIFHSASANLCLFGRAAANNRRRCLWEDKCFLSGTSYLKAFVPCRVSRACLVHWLKCHRDEQARGAGGQSSAQNENRGKGWKEKKRERQRRLQDKNIKLACGLSNVKLGGGRYVWHWFWNDLIRADLLEKLTSAFSFH